MEVGHCRRSHRAQLVQPRLAVYDKRADMTKFLQRLDDERNQRGVGDADQLPAHAGRVGQWTEDVHDGGEPQFSADRPHVPHRRMEQGGEHEDHPRLLEDPPHLFGAELDADV